MYWQLGLDSHDQIYEKFKGKDKELEDNILPPENKLFARCEVVPENGNYLSPKGWIVKVDEEQEPSWWTLKHRRLADEVRKKWLKQVYAQINLKEARAPIHPFKIAPPKRITEKHLALLHEWASVWASVRDSVWASVGDSVWASVGASVWASVWASVGDSVGDSVWAYVGFLFPKIASWKYVDKTKPPFNKIHGYPYQSAVKLWKLGLIPSYDGKVWRLHGHADARILWEGTLEQLKEAI